MLYSVMLIVMRRFIVILGISTAALLACTGVQMNHGVMVETVRVHEEAEKYSYNAEIPEVRGLDDAEAQKIINERLRVIAERQKRLFMRDVNAVQTQSGTTVKSGMTIGYRTARADNRLVSVVFVMSPYMAGAAHPNHFTMSFNYDVPAKKEISLDQLFNDTAYLTNLSEIASEKLTTQSRLAGTYYDGKEALIQKGTRPTVNTFRSYSIGGNAITFHFDPYEVGSYAEGIQQVTLSGSVFENQLSTTGVELLLN